MNLLEYLKQHENEEVAVFDKDYDMETYFEYSDKDSKDNWNRAMDRIAEHLEVTEEMDENKRVYEEVPCVIVNMMEVMEQSIETGVMDDLFISKNIGAVMNDMPNILAGYVSEEWLMDFADALDKAESFQQEKKSRTAEALEM